MSQGEFWAVVASGFFGNFAGRLTWFIWQEYRRRQRIREFNARQRQYGQGTIPLN